MGDSPRSSNNVIQSGEDVIEREKKQPFTSKDTDQSNELN